MEAIMVNDIKLDKDDLQISQFYITDYLSKDKN